MDNGHLAFCFASSAESQREISSVEFPFWRVTTLDRLTDYRMGHSWTATLPHGVSFRRVRGGVEF